MAEMQMARDPAELRLWQMTLLRLAGVLMAVAGLLWLGRGHSVTGAALMLSGAIVTLVAPKWLYRRWRR